MRTDLKKQNGKRLRFIAEVDRFGSRRNYHGFPEDTICFRNVRFENGDTATDHVWFTVGKRIGSLNLSAGDSISFEAKISDYLKGYVNYREYIDCREVDYKLNNPTKIKKIEIPKSCVLPDGHKQKLDCPKAS